MDNDNRNIVSFLLYINIKKKNIQKYKFRVCSWGSCNNVKNK